MEYDLNQLNDPSRFQRLVNAILTARFGENVRLTPLKGRDGGSDGETAPRNPHMEFTVAAPSAPTTDPLREAPRPGRYQFQAKYHVTGHDKLSALRARVLREFETSLTDDILNRPDRSDVDYFFMVTNVPSSDASLSRLDELRKRLLIGRPTLHADIWWGERITSALDWAHTLWPAFPEIFPGGVPPVISQASHDSAEGLAQTLRLAIAHQYKRDSVVNFRQLGLEHSLDRIFVDLDAELSAKQLYRLNHLKAAPNARGRVQPATFRGSRQRRLSGLRTLIDDELAIPRLLLEGGPGQGKSTLTQMAAQIYRENLLNTSFASFASRFSHIPSRSRIPFRIELRHFANWLTENATGTLEQYVASEIRHASGGAAFTVSNLHAVLRNSPAILFLDGLDEIGQDAQRDLALSTVMATIGRLETGLRVDLRVVLTTRPPGISGRRAKLDRFVGAHLTPMEPERVDEYVTRWLGVQVPAQEERDRIEESFQVHRRETHVTALSRNPMQLAVLLHFIYLKGAAFPDHRASLYQNYFQVVLDRDVEKSPALGKVRELMVGLHAFLGFRLHGATEISETDRTLQRREIIELSESWLRRWGKPEANAEEFFVLGAERFGLVVAISGEAANTRYGFAVQPIQEYFAAEYISNYLPKDDAHGVFGRLVHRPYWREVALFLAGLRRPNEKADLILVARQADTQVNKRWRENGRLLVLQLLQERVFSNPLRVSDAAIDYIADIVDLDTLRFQRFPTGCLDSVCALAREFRPDLLSSRLLDAARTAVDQQDHVLTSILYQALAKWLKPDDYVDFVSGHDTLDDATRTLVRFGCVYSQPELLAALAKSPAPWTGPARNLWADRLWESVQFYRFVADLPYSDAIHRRLLIRFCGDDSVPVRYGDGGITIRGSKTLAVWKLNQASEQIARDLDYYDMQGGRASENAGSVITQDEDARRGRVVSYGGISGELRACVQDLTVASGELACALADGELERARNRLGSYVGALSEHSQAAGLAGWVTCRCAVELFQARHVGRLSHGREETMRALRGSIARYYDSSETLSSEELHNAVQQAAYGPYSTPPRIRMKVGQDPVGVDEVICGLLHSGSDAERAEKYGWFADLPIPIRVLRLTVEKAGDRMESVLRYVGTKTVAGWDGGPRLRVAETQRVLRICAHTEDPDVLRGAATILANAAFGGIAKPERIAKILRAAPSSIVVRRLFDVYGEPFYPSKPKVEESMWNLAQDVARHVLDEPDTYAFSVVNGAAQFLAETESRTGMPLFEKCPEFAQH